MRNASAVRLAEGVLEFKSGSEPARSIGVPRRVIPAPRPRRVLARLLEGTITLLLATALVYAGV